VVGDTNSRIADVEVAAALQIWIVEAGRLHHDAAILDANIEAGAELVGDASPVKGSDIRAAAKILKLCLRVKDRRIDIATRTAFKKRIEVLVCEVVDVGSGKRL